MPGKVVRVLVKTGDVGPRPSAARRRRSDEDGERDARQPRRDGRRDSRPRRACRSRRARCSSSFSEVAHATSDVPRGFTRLRERRILRYASFGLAATVVVLAVAIVTSLTVDLGPSVRGHGRARRLEVHRAPAAHRRAGHPPPQRQGPSSRTSGSTACTTTIGRSLPPRWIDVRLDWAPAAARKPDFTISSVEMTDWQMLVEKWEERPQLSALRARRWTAETAAALHGDAAGPARASRPVHVRGSRDAVERRLPEPRHQDRQPAELPRHREVQRRHGAAFSTSCRCGRA